MKTEGPIILVGGGTGGHITPLIAVGEELIAHRQPFIVIGGRDSREQQLIGDLGWKFYPILQGKWRRDGTLMALGQNLVDMLRAIGGFFQALSILVSTGGRRVFCKGGAVSVPVVYAARLLGRSVVVHESDAVMGLTNRLAARFARKVLTAFDPKHFPHADQRYRQAGIPIRQVLRQSSKLKAPQKNRPLILIIGGIQGAAAINSLVRDILPELLKVADVVHATGEKEIDLHKQLQADLAAEKVPGSYKPYAFIDRELPYYFQTADLIISRASATTIAEGALFSRAMYLIPLPHAAGNHQVVNAQLLLQAKAAVVGEQLRLAPERFLEEILALLHDPQHLQSLGQNLNRYFNEEHSLEIIVEELTTNGKKS